MSPQDPQSQVPQEQVPPAEPRCSWVVMCVHCGKGTDVPLPFDHAGLSLFLAQIGWFVSVMSPPGQGPEVPILLGGLCETCAPTVFPPEVMAVAEQRRQQMIQAAQVPQVPR